MATKAELEKKLAKAIEKEAKAKEKYLAAKDERDQFFIRYSFKTIAESKRKYKTAVNNANKSDDAYRAALYARMDVEADLENLIANEAHQQKLADMKAKGW